MTRFFLVKSYQKFLKNHTRKIDKIYKDFELYQVFKHNFLGKMFGYSDYILLTRRINTFWSKCFDNSSVTVLAKKITQEKSTKFIKIFELYQDFLHNFLSRYPQIIYYWLALKAFLPLPNFISKNWFYFFSSSSGKHQSHHLVGYHALGINPIQAGKG